MVSRIVDDESKLLSFKKTSVEVTDSDKTSSLYYTELITTVKCFTVQAPWDLHNKTLWISNSWHLDRFRSKLVTFGLDKYTDLNEHNSFHGVGRSRIRNTFLNAGPNAIKLYKSVF